MGFISHQQCQSKEYEPGLFGIKLLDGASGSKHISMLRGWLKPGSQHAPHTHEVEEAIIFLSGRGIQRIGSHQYEVGPGDCVHVPPGVVHSTLNTGDEELMFVAAYPDSVISGQPVQGPISQVRQPSWPGIRYRLAWLLRQGARRLNPPLVQQIQH